jgi:3-dehydroquinate synthase
MLKTHYQEFKGHPGWNHSVLIGYDILSSVLGIVEGTISSRRIAILTDENVVEAGHLKRLDPKRRRPVFAVKPDETGGVESKKNTETLGEIGDFLEENRFEKNDTLICLGGGVIGDIGGLAACLYKRVGMNLVHCPTTSMSQIDSSIGGKCAVNTRVAKNTWGYIYQPRLVVIDIKSLGTLDERHYRSGLVEGVNRGIILDKDHYRRFEERIGHILAKDNTLLEEITLNNVRLKGRVVGIDPEEKNYRMCLNLGHTVGHALERVSDFKLYHGEAVALGLLAALYISREIRGFPDEEFDRVQDLLVNRLDMPDRVPDYINRKTVKERMVNDKKVIDGIPQFVTVERIGQLYTAEDGRCVAAVPKEAFNPAMDYIFK